MRRRRPIWKPPVESEVQDELSHHFELLIAEGMRRGLSREASEREARARFGRAASVQQDCEHEARGRDRRRAVRNLLSDLRDDLRWTLRSLRRSPAYALSAGLTLALVVLANALVFTLVYGILLRPLPYPDPHRLVAINEQTPAGDLWEVSLPNLETLRAQAPAFDGMAGWYRSEVILQNEAMPRLPVAIVTADFFPLLGTPARLGRTLQPADQAGGEGKPLVLSETAWRTWFGADPAILGRAVGLNAEMYTVVGVMPADFRFPLPDVAGWIPWGPWADWMRNRSVHLAQVVGRVRPDFTLAGAAGQAATIMGRIQAAHPGEDPEHGFVVRDLHQSLTGGARGTLLLLLGSVAAVLILACANLAGLAVMRTAARSGELALRAALGAGRGRLVRQLLVESALLGIVAGGLGLAAASVLLEPALSLLPADVPRPGRIALNRTVVGVTLGISLLAGLIIGLVAAWREARRHPGLALREGAPAATMGGERLRLQRSLVAGQLALSLLLLTGAGLLLRSLRQVIRVDPGYATGQVLTAMVSLPSRAYPTPQVREWYRLLPERLMTVPGVLAASAISSLPLAGGDSRGDLTVEGHDAGPGLKPAATFRRVLPNYFRAMGIPLIRGREFSDRDGLDGDPVVIVSRSLAERYWPGQDPLGRRIKVGPPEGEPWLTIVGVVGDVRHESLERDPLLDTYEPHPQRPRSAMGVVVRTAGHPAALAGAVRGALRATDPGIPVWDVQTLQQRLAGTVATRRFTAAITAGFSGTALLLAAIGLFGLSGYGVSRRRREFAIRMALGAGAPRVRAQVLRDALGLAGLGLLAGVPASLLLTRLIGGMLFQVSPADPTVLGASAVVLALAAVAAAWIPARRATLTDPARALRE